MNSSYSTETALREWRYGSTQAERLAAAVLRLEKFSNVEPQAPLGGGDDGADILCDRGGKLWVGAVYFPPTIKEFKDVRGKFKNDLAGAKERARHGIVFLTNQRLTRGERQELTDLSLQSQQECIVYDIERLRGVLDSPEGYGARVSYLRIPMGPEEQIAYFASRENILEGAMATSAEHMKRLSLQLDNLEMGQQHVAHSVDLIAKVHNIDVEPLRSFDPLAMGDVIADPGAHSVLDAMSADLICYTHRLVCFDLPPRSVGRFRNEQIYIVKGAAAPGAPTITPPGPSEVEKLVEELCGWWRRLGLSSADDERKLEVVVEFFHRFLFIHPFTDGNGRVARSLLMQQCLELFGHVDMSLLDRGLEYYAALQAADEGDFAPLRSLIARTVAS